MKIWNCYHIPRRLIMYDCLNYPLTLFLVVLLGVCACVFAMVCSRGQGQLLGVSSLLLCGSRYQPEVVSLGCKGLNLLNLNPPVSNLGSQ